MIPPSKILQNLSPIFLSGTAGGDWYFCGQIGTMRKQATSALVQSRPAPALFSKFSALRLQSPPKDKEGAQWSPF